MSDLWTEDEIENRILGTLPMPVHHAMNLRECLYQIQARDERIRKLMSVHAEAEDELKDMTRRFWKQVEETETAHRRIRELEEQPR